MAHVITKEIFQGKCSTCLNCKKAIKPGEETIVVRDKFTKRVKARFCSHNCQNEKAADNIMRGPA